MKNDKLDLSKTQDYLQLGLKNIKEHLGEFATRQIEELEQLSPVLAEALIIAFGLFYNHDTCVLEQKYKELCVVSVLTAQGNLPQLKTHIEAALRVGARREEVIEAIVQTTPYSGFPAVLNAMTVVKELFVQSEPS